MIQTISKNNIYFYLQKLEHIESPYEFLRLWQSLKDDANLMLHAKLLRIVPHKDINKSK